MSPDELARIAARVGASRPHITDVSRTGPLSIEVAITLSCAADMLPCARDLEMLLVHIDHIRRSLEEPGREARSMERAVRIIGEIVNGQKPYNEAEIEVEVLRIFGRIE